MVLDFIKLIWSSNDYLFINLVRWARMRCETRKKGRNRRRKRLLRLPGVHDWNVVNWPLNPLYMIDAPEHGLLRLLCGSPCSWPILSRSKRILILEWDFGLQLSNNFEAVKLKEFNIKNVTFFVMLLSCFVSFNWKGEQWNAVLEDVEHYMIHNGFSSFS